VVLTALPSDGVALRPPTQKTKTFSFNLVPSEFVDFAKSKPL